MPATPPRFERNAAGQLVPVTRVEPAFARNGVGADCYGNRSATVFVTEDEAGKRSLGWFNGEAKDGDVWECGPSLHFRLTLVAGVGAAERRAA